LFVEYSLFYFLVVAEACCE